MDQLINLEIFHIRTISVTEYNILIVLDDFFLFVLFEIVIFHFVCHRYILICVQSPLNLLGNVGLK